VGVRDEAFVRSIACGPLASFESNSLGSRNKKVDFFWSTGKQFMIKSLTEMEMAQVARILPSYLRHLDNQPDSLLARFCALYTVETAPTTSLPIWERVQWPFRPRVRRHYVVMKNSLHPSREMLSTFDLKGSTLGRRTLPLGPPAAAASPSKAVLKDLDYLESGLRLQLAPALRKVVAEQLNADVSFLNSIEVMDYSLLLAVSAPRPSLRRALGGLANRLKRVFFFRGRAETKSQDLEVYLGIIDFLQPYSWTKWAETMLKGVAHDMMEVSAVDPDIYAQRFKAFMLQVAFPSQA
jgi:1-phosphatidylinositol-4-phosphate 5-kinase